jgi:hypothetical protein
MQDSGAKRAAGMWSRIHSSSPATGLAFGEPDDRLRRAIQYSGVMNA